LALTRQLEVSPLESASLNSRWLMSTIGHLKVGSVLGSTASTRELPVRVCSSARIGYSSETRVILVGGVAWGR